MKLSKSLIVTGLLFSSILGAVNSTNNVAEASLINLPGLAKPDNVTTSNPEEKNPVVPTSKAIQVKYVDENGKEILDPALNKSKVVILDPSARQVKKTDLSLPGNYKVSDQGNFDIKNNQITVTLTNLDGLGVDLTTVGENRTINVVFVDENGKEISDPALNKSRLVVVKSSDRQVKKTDLTIPGEYRIYNQNDFDIKDNQIKVTLTSLKDLGVNVTPNEKPEEETPEFQNGIDLITAGEQGSGAEEEGKAPEFQNGIDLITAGEQGSGAEEEGKAPEFQNGIDLITAGEQGSGAEEEGKAPEFQNGIDLITAGEQGSVTEEEEKAPEFQNGIDLITAGEQGSVTEEEGKAPEFTNGIDLITAGGHQVGSNGDSEGQDKNPGFTNGIDLVTAGEQKAVTVKYVDTKGREVKDSRFVDTILVLKDAKEVSLKNIDLPSDYLVNNKKAIEIKNNSITVIISKKSNSNGSVTTKPSTTTPSNKHVVKVQDFKGTVATTPGQYVTLYNAEGKAISGRRLAGDSNWAADKTMVRDGVKYYRVATNEWVKASDVYEYTVSNAVVETAAGNYKKLFDSKGNIVSNRGLAAGTKWMTDKVALIQGEKMYRVATNEWLKVSDVK